MRSGLEGEAANCRKDRPLLNGRSYPMLVRPAVRQIIPSHGRTRVERIGSQSRIWRAACGAEWPGRTTVKFARPVHSSWRYAAIVWFPRTRWTNVRGKIESGGISGPSREDATRYPEVRTQLLMMAAGFERLADQVEKWEGGSLATAAAD